MMIKILAMIALVSTVASGAVAHSRVNTTTPADGAAFSETPSNVSFEFAADIRLTRVEMVHQDHPAVRLDLGEQTRFGRAFTLPLQGQGDGRYRIEWRGLGKDGHAMQGVFTFTVE